MPLLKLGYKETEAAISSPPHKLKNTNCHAVSWGDSHGKELLTSANRQQ